jgi:hypothetical protein
MFRKTLLITMASLLLASTLAAQGLVTTATKDDWEEINFEFDSSILSDGYPSLLRLAELLIQNPDFRVTIQGHTDFVGSDAYNDKLAAARSNAVKAFLEKYGARPGQVIAESRGKRDPKVDNRTKEGRFINRRVVMTVRDGQGRLVSEGGVRDAIRGIEQLAKKQEECCDNILKRLDKLDEILAALRDLRNENAQLRRDLEGLKARPQPAPVQQAVVSPAPAPAGPPGPAGPGAPAAPEVAGARAPGAPGRGLSILNLNAGPDGSGDLTFSGRGRYFAPFGSFSALQAQAEYMYFREQKEGQFDVGLVNRFKDVQLGLFSSFKTVSFNRFQNSGTLGQGSLTFDWLHKYGRLGLFGSKGFLNNAVVNRVSPSRNFVDETYLRIADQLGGSTALGLHKNVWFEGNLGWVKTRSGDDKPGGTLRFLFPVNNRFAFTVEGGFNETLIQSDNSGRVVFGLQFGNFLSPREFRGLEGPAPVDVPRIRYELLTRRIRTGNDAPVADAGPDQIGIVAGQVRLDGSASFDPDGDPITFQWTQTAGPSVTLSAPTSAVTTFTAVEGQSYGFRLTVRDSQGAQGLDGVTITTRDIARVRINRFAATPNSINAGQSAELSWEVENADEVTISPGIGAVDRVRGTRTVTPTETTTYTLTARNRAGDSTAIATVTVGRPGVRISRFTASAPIVILGESSTLCWDTIDATSAEITPGIGAVRPSGCVDVTPTQTTSYTLIARNAFGETRATVTVSVRDGAKPVIVNFRASPDTVVEGSPATLSWVTEEADEVSIDNGVGTVALSGNRQVTPATTTTYTLTARNRFGQVVATATVVVEARMRIVTFIASANPVTAGQVTTVSWVTENATAVQISGEIGDRPTSGQLILRPTADVTLTLTALGRLGQRATQTLTITVNPPPIPNRPPVASAGQGFSTAFRDVVLDGSASVDPDGDPITYSWVSVGGTATVHDPTSARTRVTLGETPGEYAFELTVTDSRGASTMTNVVVRLTPPPAQPAKP